MNRTSHNTLAITFIILFFISINASANQLTDRISACNSALSKGDWASAVVASDEILKVDRNNRDGLLCKGRALGAQGKYDAALNVLEMAAKQSQPGFDEIIANIFIGNLHKGNNKNAEAIASYEKSLKICEAEKNDKFKRISLNLMGEAQAQNNGLNAALASYLAGSKLAMNDNERADSFERLGTIYSALGQHDSAIEYQLKATLMQQKSGTLDQYADASLALGKAYEKAEEYANAENTYTKLIQFAKENGGAYYEAKASFDLAQIKAASGDTAKAKSLMGNALKLAKTVGDTGLTAEIETALNKMN
ncbi:MAG: tetratricopeptide repeat protein [Methylotenera sp.]